jgi:hypothetical protein
MENMQIIELEQFGGVKVQYVVIDLGNGEFTSTPKDIYDEMIAKREASPL